MPRQSKDKAQDIYFVFPRDYMQLYSLLSVNGDKVELICKDFNAHPEYDLPYKLLSMIYSSDRYDCFESLKGDPEKDYNPLRFYRNGDGTWRDYLFQIPGICELLGIKRELDIDIEKGYISRILSNSDKNSKGFLMEVFQIPILFLILVEQKISNGDFVPDEIIGLINKAIFSYTQNKKRKLFNKAQLESCYDFFLNTSGNCAFRSWCVGRDFIAFDEMKIEVKRIVNDYIKNTNEKTEEFKHSSEIGTTISFPKYMRSIMLGIYERYDCLELILPMVNKNTLWTNTDEMVLKNISKETARTFRAFQNYLYYRSEANKLLDSCETFIEEIGELQEIKYNACYVNIKEKVERINRLRGLSANHLIVSDKMRKIRNKIEKNRKKVDKILEESYTSYYKTVGKKLTDYYTFCIYTLYKVSQEKEKYKGMAQDAFERVFSIYLFNKETDLLYEKFEELYNKAKEEKDICSKVKLIKYIFNWISSNGMHAIYYSPGVYHRVRLAEYIIRTKLDINLLESLYMDNIVYSENTLNDSVISEIADINQDYMIAEKEYIYKWVSDKKEFTKENIIAEYKSNEENACCKEYNNFYNTIYSKIDNVLNDKFQEGKTKRFGKVDASRIAKTMLGQMPIEKRLLHFWVILYSFISEDSLIKVS